MLLVDKQVFRMMISSFLSERDDAYRLIIRVFPFPALCLCGNRGNECQE